MDKDPAPLRRRASRKEGSPAQLAIPIAHSLCLKLAEVCRVTRELSDKIGHPWVWDYETEHPDLVPVARLGLHSQFPLYPYDHEYFYDPDTEIQIGIRNGNSAQEPDTLHLKPKTLLASSAPEGVPTHRSLAPLSLTVYHEILHVCEMGRGSGDGEGLINYDCSPSEVLCNAFAAAAFEYYQYGELQPESEMVRYGSDWARYTFHYQMAGKSRSLIPAYQPILLRASNAFRLGRKVYFKMIEETLGPNTLIQKTSA